jgi:hypothetical protein
VFVNQRLFVSLLSEDLARLCFPRVNGWRIVSDLKVISYHRIPIPDPFYESFVKEPL